jgi:hypothetical protein
MPSRWIVVVLLLCATALQAGASSEIRRSVLAGGATGGSGAGLTLNSTLGQVVTGRAEAGTHAVLSGFWSPRPLASGAPEHALPERFQLYAAAPNPFLAGTALRFDVPASGGRVSLRVYDVAGRAVRTLLEGEATPGRQVAQWDGNDEWGRRIALGLYLCTFEAPGYRRSVKLVHIR